MGKKWEWEMYLPGTGAGTTAKLRSAGWQPHLPASLGTSSRLSSSIVSRSRPEAITGINKASRREGWGEGRRGR